MTPKVQSPLRAVDTADSKHEIVSHFAVELINARHERFSLTVGSTYFNAHVGHHEKFTNHHLRALNGKLDEFRS
eukprot:m.698627 g.698627  ORF g.698627 m.698627 type:complete len:74 (+) comp22902_c0_seq18:61-282(+)